MRAAVSACLPADSAHSRSAIQLPSTAELRSARLRDRLAVAERRRDRSSSNRAVAIRPDVPAGAVIGLAQACAKTHPGRYTMDIHNVGGTPGGTRTFLLGLIMA